MELYWIYWMCVILLCVHVDHSNEQNIPSSPCQDMFQYQRDGYEFIGLVQMQSLPLGQAMKLEVMLSLRAKLPSQFVGAVELYGSRQDAIQEIRSNQKVRYRVRFPVQDPLPRLTQLSLNGQVYCRGPPETGAFVTQIKLEHTLFTEIAGGHSVSGFDNYLYPYDPYLAYNNPDNYYYSQIYKSPIAQDTPQQPPQYQTHTPYQPSATQFQAPTTQYQTPAPYQTNPQYHTETQRPPYQIDTQAPSHQIQPAQQIPVNPPYIQPQPTYQGTSDTSQFECGKPHPKTNFVSLVVGGESVLRGAWPWLVAVYLIKPIGTQFNCGGNLVSAKTVVTAAHCFRTSERTYQANEIQLLLGRHNLLDWQETGYKIAQVDQIIIHSEYMTKGSSYDADIAVAIMRNRVEFTEFIRPICLWEGPDNLNGVVGQMGTVIGWGRDGSGKIVTTEPKKINVPIVSEADCLRSSDTYRYITSDRTFCAGRRDGRGPCNGDSGGGMTFKVNNKWMLRGIVSAALSDPIVNSCNLAEYVVFTDAAKFVGWIRSYMR